MQSSGQDCFFFWVGKLLEQSDAIRGYHENTLFPHMVNSDLHRHYFLFNGHYFLNVHMHQFLLNSYYLWMFQFQRFIYCNIRIISYGLVVQHLIPIPTLYLVCSIIYVYFHSWRFPFGIKSNASSNDECFLARNPELSGWPPGRLPVPISTSPILQTLSMSGSIVTAHLKNCLVYPNLSISVPHNNKS